MVQTQKRRHFGVDDKKREGRLPLSRYPVKKEVKRESFYGWVPTAGIHELKSQLSPTTRPTAISRTRDRMWRRPMLQKCMTLSSLLSIPLPSSYRRPMAPT